MQLLNVYQAAQALSVSESWIRRHVTELPVVRVGRNVRFDNDLISTKFHATMHGGKSLMPERKQMLSRYQQGSVNLKGKRIKMWYGTYREDVRTPDGQMTRRQRIVRLGSLVELPTKNKARKKLSELLDAPMQNASMTFRELAERWAAAEGPTIKPSTLAHYRNALRAYLLPVYGEREIKTITREEIQRLLAERAAKYSRSVLRTMRVVLSLILGWATDCQLLEKSPCTRIKLPIQTGGRTVTRTVLTVEQIAALTDKLEEPYATLVLFLAATGLRIGEALAVKWTDIEDNAVKITRRIYDGKIDTPKSKASIRELPVAPELLERMRKLGNSDWVFCSRVGTPLNPGNGMKRYVHPAAKELGITLGGWHDFRHTITTNMRRSGVHPKVISGVLGQSKVTIAMDVYDRTTVDDFRAPLNDVAGELLSSVIKLPASALSRH